MRATSWHRSTRRPPPKAPSRTKIPPDQGVGPLRTCVGCRAVRPQRELVRVVRTSDATLVPSRTLAGRGAWLCHGSLPCVDHAARKGGFARSFRAPVSTAAIAELRSAMAADQQR